MFVGEILRMLQAVPDPYEIFPGLDTAYSKYSNSNYAASDWEYPPIRKIISEQKAQLDDIDTIIGRVEIILNQFHEKREQIAASIVAHESFVTGIHRLPPEILGEVFMQCLPQRMPVNPDAKAAPLFLTGICKRWREVALDTPRLWSSLVVKESVQQLAHCYHNWLKNAKDCPLSFEVDMHSPPAVPDSGWRRAALEFLQQYTSRLRSFTVGFDEADTLDLLFRDMPRLERLCLTGNMELLRGHRLSTTQPEPRLHTLIIHSPTFCLENLSLFIPGWMNLTHLAVVLGADQFNVPDPIFFLLLQMCPNLEHFVFSPVHSAGLCQSILPSFTFTHSKLRALKITEECAAWNSFQEYTLMLPNLCYLDIRNDVDYYDPIHSEDVFIPELPLHEGRRHRVLNIKFAVIDYALLTILDPGWTALTHIRTDLNDCADVMISFYVLQLCPNLEYLVISSMDVFNDDFYYTAISHPVLRSQCIEITEITISHPVLRSLSIEITGGPYDRLLDLFTTFPSLCHLDLTLPANLDWPHANFLELLSRSNSPLDTLKIVGPAISTEEGEELASLLPTLRHVELLYNTGPDTEEC